MKNKTPKKKNELDDLKAKAEEYLAGWQRAKADYENFKKETDKRMSEVSGFAKAGLLSDIIPILDNFSKAIEHVPEDQQSEGWVQGVFHIKKQLEDFLAANGLEKIKTIGKEFDHNLHEAVGKEKAEQEKDIIIKEVSSGYKLNGQAIIPAKVIVSE
ncbi:nucleotide exchange factor GrpE [Patescibacteria group bacterium]